MLEVRSLTKIYKGKKGADVHALDGVSLKFPETGMVFLLGKSGSGKSTLLNVCGGLDSPTSGEIIVKGRSSLSFSGGDFDSYRNTYVGFVFQEYNILNEFSVEDNIALALELQGRSKRKNRKAIRSLLEQVDLKGYAKRKPNTLSGGQKQRIAIARALVKNPEIIMADEPTGALDSNTGKQVLDTLKKLSESKLVIVVSHDREFAEIYADRIIELMDGKVISDISKTQLTQTVISENISEVDNVLCIKKGAELTVEELDRINRFLKDAPNDVMIARKEKDIKSFKKIGRIKDDGSREVFSDTDEKLIEKREYTAAESKFIRSKLPLRHAIKIGVSGMKRKPIRLLLTIFLCTVAFIMFGVLSTLSFYDNEATFKETLPNSGVSILNASKSYLVNVAYYQDGEKQFSYEDFRNTLFNNADIENLNSKYAVNAFGGSSVRWYITVNNSHSYYWSNEILCAAYLPKAHPYRERITLGRYPEADTEIVISSYTANMLVEKGFYGTDGKLIECKTVNDVVGRSLDISGERYTVVGIFDSGEIPAKYDALKTSDSVSLNDALYSEFTNLLADGTHLMIFTNEDRIKRLADDYKFSYSDLSEYRSITSALYLTGSDTIQYPDYTNALYSSASESGLISQTHWIHRGQTDLADDEVILPVDLLYNFIMENLEKEIAAHPEKEEDFYNIAMHLEWLMMNGKEMDEESGTVIQFTEAERKATLDGLAAALSDSGLTLEYGFILYTPYDEEPLYGMNMPRLKVAGLIDGETPHSYPLVLFSNNTYRSVWGEQSKHISYSEETSKYVVPENAIYGTVFIPYDGSKRLTDMCWEIYDNKEFDEDGSRVSVSSSFIYTLEFVDSIVDTLSKVFMWIGIILAVFAALLFSNFISISISYKKREIGILRAVGARGLDVFKIFFSESAVISIICVILSTVFSVLICNAINTELSKGIGVSLFVFGIPSFAVMVGIACLTAVVATFLPVFSAARKKPVDSIRSL